jgi:hypothetical protein
VAKKKLETYFFKRKVMICTAQKWQKKILVQHLFSGTFVRYIPIWVNTEYKSYQYLPTVDMAEGNIFRGFIDVYLA